MNVPASSRSRISYGWIIVFVCTLSIAFSYGILYSYSVFFKPIAGSFNWDRATVSSFYSVLIISRGATSIGIGWLADRYGPARVSVLCGILIGLGLVLTSRVTELWQLYITFGLIEAIGLGGAFTVGTSITTQWFTKNRGLALGIVSSGSGLGTFLLVPTAGFLIDSFSWSNAFLIIGISAGVLLTSTSLLLKRPSVAKNPRVESTQSVTVPGADKPDLTLGKAIRTKEMAVIVTIFFALFFCTQLLLVHLVNFATDIGISPLVAAGLVSLIGGISIIGRLLTGTIADRIGTINSLLLCCGIVFVSMVYLVSVNSLWALYVFAAIFGLAYGGEIPLIPMLINQFCGTRSLAALVGYLMFMSGLGGALGPLVGGAVFDASGSYHLAFIIAAVGGLLALVLTLAFKRLTRKR